VIGKYREGFSFESPITNHRSQLFKTGIKGMNGIEKRKFQSKTAKEAVSFVFGFSEMDLCFIIPFISFIPVNNIILLYFS
jgi:hypothetical protein